MSLRLSLAILLPLAACAGDAPSTAKDAAPGGDGGNGMPASVSEVTCPAGTLPMVTSMSDTAYSPTSVTVAVGGVVSYMMPTAHNVIPNTGNGTTTDSGLNVPYGQSKCLKFSKAGTFTFRCASHGFVGTVVVQ